MADSNFVDYVKIFARSGKGGAGSAHFRRAKYEPMGGPDGGDGGVADTSFCAAMPKCGRCFTFSIKNTRLPKAVNREWVRSNTVPTAKT